MTITRFHRNQTPGSRLRRQFAQLLGGRTAAAAIQAVTLVLVARWCGPETFAIVAAVQGIGVVAIVFADLGLTGLALRTRARDAADGHVSLYARWLHRASTALGLSWCIAVFLIALLQSSLYSLLFLPCAVWVYGDRLLEFTVAMDLASGFARRAARFLLLRRVVTLCVVLLLGLLGANPVLAFSVGMGAGSLVGLGCYQRLTLPLALDVPPPMRQTIAALFPFWVNSLGAQVRNLDVVAMNVVASPLQAGLFAVPSRLIAPLRLLPSAFAQALTPEAARVRSRAEVKTLLPSCLVVLAASTALFAVLIVLAPVVLPFLLGGEYDAAIRPLQIVLAGLCVAPLASIATSVLQAQEKEKSVAVATAAVAIFTLSAVGVVGQAGAIAAATSVACGYIIHASWLSVLLGSHMRRI